LLSRQNPTDCANRADSGAALKSFSNWFTEMALRVRAGGYVRIVHTPIAQKRRSGACFVSW